MSATGTSLNSPLRGGIHPIYGLYMGGSKLTDDYTLKSKSPYTCTMQIRNPKQPSYSEQTLIKRCSDTTSIKFNGSIEINISCITEYNKEEFITKLNEQVGYYELNSLFSMPDRTGTMHSLIDTNTHLFSLNSVVTDKSTRMVHHVPVFELDTHGIAITTDNTESTIN